MIILFYMIKDIDNCECGGYIFLQIFIYVNNVIIYNFLFDYKFMIN